VTSTRPHALIACALLAASAIALAGCAALPFVFTPTVQMSVRNDLSQTVWVSGCGSDPLELQPRESGRIDPNVGDTHAACFVYDDGNDYLGCLIIPAEQIRSGGHAAVSHLRRNVSEQSCTDYVNGYGEELGEPL